MCGTCSGSNRTTIPIYSCFTLLNGKNGLFWWRNKKRLNLFHYRKEKWKERKYRKRREKENFIIKTPKAWKHRWWWIRKYQQYNYWKPLRGVITRSANNNATVMTRLLVVYIFTKGRLFRTSATNVDFFSFVRVSHLFYFHKGSHSQFVGNPIAEISTLVCSRRSFFNLSVKSL